MKTQKKFSDLKKKLQTLDNKNYNENKKHSDAFVIYYCGFFCFVFVLY